MRDFPLPRLADAVQFSKDITAAMETASSCVPPAASAADPLMVSLASGLLIALVAKLATGKPHRHAIWIVRVVLPGGIASMILPAYGWSMPLPIGPFEMAMICTILAAVLIAANWLLTIERHAEVRTGLPVPDGSRRSSHKVILTERHRRQS